MVVQPYFLSQIIDVGIANNDINYIIKTGIIMAVFAIFAIMGGFLAMYFSCDNSFFVSTVPGVGVEVGVGVLLVLIT